VALGVSTDGEWTGLSDILATGFMLSPAGRLFLRRLLVLKEVECSVMPSCAAATTGFCSNKMHVSFMRSVAPIACVSHHAFSAHSSSV
jgi:hypothetical protein